MRSYSTIALATAALLACSACKFQNTEMPTISVGDIGLEHAGGSTTYIVGESVSGEAKGHSALFGLVHWGDAGTRLRLPLVAPLLDVILWPITGSVGNAGSPGYSTAFSRAVDSAPNADTLLYPSVTHTGCDFFVYSEWTTKVQGKAIEITSAKD